MSRTVEQIRKRHKEGDEQGFYRAAPKFKQVHEDRAALLLIIGRLEAQLAEATARADAFGWQPIETAPRDGTPVDLWHINGFRVTEVWWTDDCWSDCTDDSDFTHWMPLPEPPK